MSENGHTSPGLLAVIGSVLSAAFGVQKGARHERDFTRGRPGQYILVGLIFAVLFVLIVIGVVKVVLSAAGL